MSDLSIRRYFVHVGFVRFNRYLTIKTAYTSFTLFPAPDLYDMSDLSYFGIGRKVDQTLAVWGMFFGILGTRLDLARRHRGNRGETDIWDKGGDTGTHAALSDSRGKA